MITSLSNEKVKHARALVHQHKARERHQQFVIEGVRLAQEAERAGIVPALLFCADEFAHSAEGQRLAQRWPSALALVSEKVLAALSDTLTPQGVVVVVPQPRLTATQRDLVLVVDGVRDPGNLGTLLRSALAAGVDEALLSVGCADPYSPKVVRAAMGAHFHLPLQGDLDWQTIHEHVVGLDVLLADAAGELDYAQWDWRKPSALLVGSEAEGASRDGRALATQRVRIPMRAASESLNVAVAGSVILFEAARQRRC
ncbi:MAG: RNA methyltransferase [Chloroflexota bacterium]